MSRNSALPAPSFQAGSVSAGLDPQDWPTYRTLAHKMLDEALGLIEGVREGPVWQPMPKAVQHALVEPMPRAAQGAERAADEAARLILPYTTGNTHPRFFGWVHGSGQAGGVIAEMLAAAMNSNAGGRDHGAIHVERQVIEWCRGLFGFPDGASGLIVSGTSMATLIALTVARNRALGPDARKLGLGASAKPLVAYTSKESHSSVVRAIEMLGLGSDALRALPVDAAFRMPTDVLREVIRADRAAGKLPFAVIATAGTVNTGAIDPLAEIADVCAEEGIWLHVDGAFGALLQLSETLRPRLTGIRRADSLAFDFHKWLHVAYDAGCVLVRDGAAHRAAFASRPTYLAGAARGLAAGEPWPCDFGPELSRGFRALKIWFALKEHGTDAFAAAIEDNCRLARLLGDRVAADPKLQLLAPVTLNIANFRMRAEGYSETQLDQLNEDIVAELQLRGIAAPSTTRIGGKLAIRVNITNHRTREADIDILHRATVEIGRELIAAQAIAAEAPHALPFEFQSTVETALARPEIAASRGELDVRVVAATPAMFLLLPQGHLQLSPDGLVNSHGAAVLIRHAAELSVLAKAERSFVPLARQASHALLAARTAGRYLALLPAHERDAAESALPEWLLTAYHRLARPLDPMSLAGLAGRHDDLMANLMTLSAATPESLRTLQTATELRVTAVNDFAQGMDLAAPVEHLVTHGGDARIRIDPRTGRNGYGSSARPVRGEISFGSSTATCISADAYASVEAMRRSLVGAALAGSGVSAKAAELERLRLAVARHSGAARVAGASVVLTASGTDAELATLALALALAQDGRPITSIVISPEETGSGVPHATLGRHFSTETALGGAVTLATPIDCFGTGRVDSMAVAIRDASGLQRPAAEIGAEVARHCEAAIAAGRRVLLHVLDAAKTGIGAPALADVMALTERYGDAIDVVVDACQARLGQDAIAAYLACGWLVQITGSKFWGGPPFSGALLVPASMRGRKPELAPLAAYMTRHDWPDAFAASRLALPDQQNLGLMARWNAAITEAERLAALSEGQRIELARQFTGLVEDELQRHPELLPVAGAPFDRAPFCSNDPWAGVRTIIPVIPTRINGGVRQALTLDEAKRLHKALANGPEQPIHLGQPVKLGQTAAVRICASGRTILAMAQPGGVATIREQIKTALEKMRDLLEQFAMFSV